MSHVCLTCSTQEHKSNKNTKSKNNKTKHIHDSRNSVQDVSSFSIRRLFKLDAVAGAWQDYDMQHMQHAVLRIETALHTQA